MDAFSTFNFCCTRTFSSTPNLYILTFCQTLIPISCSISSTDFRWWWSVFLTITDTCRQRPVKLYSNWNIERKSKKIPWKQNKPPCSLCSTIDCCHPSSFRIFNSYKCLSVRPSVSHKAKPQNSLKSIFSSFTLHPSSFIFHPSCDF